MSYDVYYATGGGSLVYGGSDVWVNNWLREVAPKLNHPSKLLIHRRRPDDVKVDSSIEVIWQGDDPKNFYELINNCRKLHILHGYYHPLKVIEENKDKIESLCVHVSLDLSLKAGFDLGLKKIDAEIICMLNNDVEVTPSWTAPVLELFKLEKNTAIIQPKLLNYNKKEMFDYAGAAGGFLDKFGYPYCRGRLYNSIEIDNSKRVKMKGWINRGDLRLVNMHNVYRLPKGN